MGFKKTLYFFFRKTTNIFPRKGNMETKRKRNIVGAVAEQYREHSTIHGELSNKVGHRTLKNRPLLVSVSGLVKTVLQ